ncbi:hypothetical protein THRCLA_21657 [Thraustotheca clavata]|uniref:LIM zinc-binding domain-containing protein n=1 Tax=Thraustotheca clavata TaxID=74557 RepID=A0A1V9ZRU1_9STRA|nr:hypothetical protein THRCLA_21657 [Thraustotheca clavata]
MRPKEGHLYHRSCFKCSECASQLGLDTFAYHGTKLLCKTHYVSLFSTTNSYGGDDRFKKQKDDNVCIVPTAAMP